MYLIIYLYKLFDVIIQGSNIWEFLKSGDMQLSLIGSELYVEDNCDVKFQLWRLQVHLK